MFPPLLPPKPRKPFPEILRPDLLTFNGQNLATQVIIISTVLLLFNNNGKICLTTVLTAGEAEVTLDQVSKHLFLYVVDSKLTPLHMSNEFLGQLSQKRSNYCADSRHRFHMELESVTAVERLDVVAVDEAHLRRAGMERALFTDAAMDAVHAFTYGIPRTINKLCTTCLMHARLQNSQLIDDQMVNFIIEREIL
jgi:hypothetical protein